MNKGEIRLTENEAGEFLTVLKVVQHAHDNDNFLNPSWCKRFADVIKLLESKLTTAQASEGVCERQPNIKRQWHCEICGKRMQFNDGICFSCNGGKDPGD